MLATSTGYEVSVFCCMCAFVGFQRSPMLGVLQAMLYAQSIVFKTLPAAAYPEDGSFAKSPTLSL